MTATTARILRDALSPDSIEPADLIDELLHSFDSSSTSPQYAAWREEAESRIDGFEAGRLTDDAVEKVFARVNRR